MISDRYIRHARSQQQGCRHGTDERGAKSQDLHGNCDGQGLQTESLSDADHNRQQAIEIAVGVEKDADQHGGQADDQRKMPAQVSQRAYRSCSSSSE